MSIKAAIIDDGVCNYCSQNISRWYVDKSYNVLEDTAADLSEYSYPTHGETCLSIINKYCMATDVIWYSIRILDIFTRKGDIKAFLSALNFCLDKQVRVIHLSIGSSYNGDFQEIEKCINRLTENRTIIVASLSNQEVVTCPACMKNVIGVRCDPKLKGDAFVYRARAYDKVDFSASSIHFLRDLKRVTPVSNSYASPLITAKVLNALDKNPAFSLGEIYQSLILSANNVNELIPFQHYFPDFLFSKKDSFILNIVTQKNSDSIFSNQIMYSEVTERLDEINISKYEWIIICVDTFVGDLVPAIRKILSQNGFIQVAIFSPFLFESHTLIEEELERVWCYQEPILYPNLGKPPKAPIICFKHFTKNRLYKLIDHLCKRFLEDGYFCKILMEDPVAELYGFDVLPNRIEKDSYIRAYNEFYQCDIILAGIFVSDDEPIQCDLVVTAEKVILSNATGFEYQDESELYSIIVKALTE